MRASPAAWWSSRPALAGYLAIALAGMALTAIADLRLAGGVHASLLQAPGDLPAHKVLEAIATGGDVAAAYQGDPLNTYPLPHELLLLPLATLHGYATRPVTTLICVAALLAALWPVAGRRRDLVPLVTSAPAAHLLAIPHVQAALSLAGIGLALGFARRGRWALAGAALALALSRPPNALPVAAVVVVAAARGGGLRRMAAGGLALMAAPTAAAFLIDPAWVPAYIENASAMLAGLPLLAARAGGMPALLALAIAPIAIALPLALAGGRRLVDVGALAAALGAVASKLSGLYSGIFVLPGLGAVGLRSSLGPAPWLVSAAVWVPVLVSAPSILGGGAMNPAFAGLAYLMAVACFPLAGAARAGRAGEGCRPARSS